MSHPSRAPARSTTVVWSFAALAVVSVLAITAVAVSGSWRSPDVRRGASHSQRAGAGSRTLVVVDGETKGMSSSGSPLMASLLTGSMPGHAMMGQVLSDSNCAPDPEGISHCENSMRLANHEVITVRHNHRMVDVPCMSPGERILVTSVPG